MTGAVEAVEQARNVFHGFSDAKWNAYVGWRGMHDVPYTTAEALMERFEHHWALMRLTGRKS